MQSHVVAEDAKHMIMFRSHISQGTPKVTPLCACASFGMVTPDQSGAYGRKGRLHCVSGSSIGYTYFSGMEAAQATNNCKQLYEDKGLSGHVAVFRSEG